MIRYEYKYRFFWLIVLLGVVACVFDDDTEFYPETQKAFLLLADTSGAKSIYLFSEKGAVPDWNEGLGLDGASISDFSSYENEWWIADVKARKILLMDPEVEQVAETHSTGEVTPDFLCAGESYVLISDSAAQQVGFLNKKNGNLQLLPMPAAPGMAVYRSRKFYVSLANQSVVILREEALAPINTVVFSRSVEALQVDNRTSIVAFTCDNLLYKSLIDYNTNALTQTESLQTADYIQVSPIRVAAYGKEWLREVLLSSGILKPGNRTGVTDFETDFFEGQVYFQAEDSLFQYKIRTRETRSLAVFRGEIRNSFFFRGRIGE